MKSPIQTKETLMFYSNLFNEYFARACILCMSTEKMTSVLMYQPLNHLKTKTKKNKGIGSDSMI